MPRTPQSCAVNAKLRNCVQALENAQVSSGKRVLIHGGSGGVGSMAVQIAKAWGAHVTSTCSSRNIQLVKVMLSHVPAVRPLTRVDQVLHCTLDNAGCVGVFPPLLTVYDGVCHACYKASFLHMSVMISTKQLAPAVLGCNRLQVRTQVLSLMQTCNLMLE